MIDPEKEFDLFARLHGNPPLIARDAMDALCRYYRPPFVDIRRIGQAWELWHQYPGISLKEIREKLAMR